MVVRLLGRRLYDPMKVWDFAENRLLGVNDQKRMKHVYREAVLRFGPDAAAVIPDWIHYNNFETFESRTVKGQVSAAKVLKNLFPTFRPYEGVFHNVADVQVQQKLILGLTHFKNEKIDNAVQDLFRRAVKWAIPAVPGKRPDDGRLVEIYVLVVACEGRMKGKGFDGEYASFFKRLKLALEQSPNGSSGGAFLDVVSSRIQELGNDRHARRNLGRLAGHPAAPLTTRLPGNSDGSP